MVSGSRQGGWTRQSELADKGKLLKFVKVANKPACNKPAPVLSLGIHLNSPG